MTADLPLIAGDCLLIHLLNIYDEFFRWSRIPYKDGTLLSPLRNAACSAESDRRVFRLEPASIGETRIAADMGFQAFHRALGIAVQRRLHDQAVILEQVGRQMRTR